MRHPTANRVLYLGLREGDLLGKPYAEFYNPRLAPLPEHVKEALLHGPVADALLPRREDAPRLLIAGEQELENGFGVHPDGSLHVAVRTAMPAVSPTMIDWWFGWHSAEPQRYKLWHPRAHVHAQWGDKEDSALAAQKGRPRYVGRVSFVDEYVGSAMTHAAIRFLRPAELGFDEQALADSEQASVVCARIHFTGYPVDVGYLVHHVRRVPGGSEMRSRFWLGGPHAQVRAGGLLDEALSRIARRVRPPGLDLGRDLLVHCSQEMSHLASFLPRLYSALREVP